MDHDFSSLNHPRVVHELGETELDLLVIGGGITGAGILLDAVSRGMKCGLIEMQDFAAGTSNRSTKLVHGGLRYLKQFEVDLVAEVGKERAIVYENGPHVTTPVWMLLPIVKGGTFGKLASSLGIFVYDYLAGVKKHERRQMLNPLQTLEKEPLLRVEGLKGAACYVEYRTDDARLTLEIIKEAVQRGAKAVNYVKAQEFIYVSGKVVGAKAVDVLTTQSVAIYAKKVVNATGPWADMLREKDGSKNGKTLHHTKGVHIVVDRNRFPLQNSVYFDVPDGRMIFAIPRDGKTYIGTTDSNYSGDLEFPRMTTADRDYLIKAVNFMFPSVRLTARDVESSWAGVRPLIHEEGKAPSEISRKDEIFHSTTGLITIAGGKLTGYRKMAEKVVNLVADELTAETGRVFRACCTDKIPMSGWNIGGSQHWPRFVEEKTNEGTALGLSRDEAQRLTRRYGTNVSIVYDIIRTRGHEATEHQLSLEVFSALLYGIQHEMTMTPSDFFIRRTSSLFFDIEWVMRWKEPVIRYMADQLGWDGVTTERHRRDLNVRITEATEAV